MTRTKHAGGRPAVTGEARRSVIVVRVTPEERARIEALAAMAGLSLSDYLRSVALKGVR